MGDDDDGDAEFGIEVVQELHDFPGGFRVEVAGGFVGEKGIRVGDNRPGDGDALLLAARELGRGVAFLFGDAHAGQRGARQLVALLARIAAIQQGQFDIFQSGGAR